MTKVFNRARMTTPTTGTGDITLDSAVTGFATFAEAGVSDADEVAYVIEEGNDFEIGIGTYTASGTTLSRDTVRLSKIGGTAGTSKMNLGGAAEVFISPLAEELVGYGSGKTINQPLFDSYADFSEISAPSNPAADTARMYAKDDGNGDTVQAWRDSAGLEHLLWGIVAQSIGSNGYVRFGNGIIIQWGFESGSSPSVTFPLQFPNNLFTIVLGGQNAGGGNISDTEAISGESTTGFDTDTGGGLSGVYWMAIGN